MNKKLLSLVGTVLVAGTAALIYKHIKSNKELKEVYYTLLDLKSRISSELDKMDPSYQLNINWFDYDYVSNIDDLDDLDGIDSFSAEDKAKMAELVTMLQDIIEIDNELLLYAHNSYAAKTILKNNADMISAYKDYLDKISA